MTPELVNHPQHYNMHPSGVETITVVRTMSFNLGSAFKYVFRRDDKSSALTDLEKALWYIEDEIASREKEKTYWSQTPAAKIAGFVVVALNNILSSFSYHDREKWITRIIRYESDELVCGIYRLLHEADAEFYNTSKLRLIRPKLHILITKYSLKEI